MTGYTCPTKRIVDLLEETWLWGLGAYTQADVGPDAALEEGGGRKNLWNWFCVQSAAEQELRVWRTADRGFCCWDRFVIMNFFRQEERMGLGGFLMGRDLMRC